MLVDANILIYSVAEESPHHSRAAQWMVDALNGSVRVGIPWISLWAFVRIVTNGRALDRPLAPADAWDHVQDWLAAPATWVPGPGQGHDALLRRLLVDHDIRGALVSDAVLAAIAMEHGLRVVSADSDFARFPEVDWLNPVAGS